MSDFITEIELIFSPSGLLSQIEGFEYRKPQQDMAVAYAESLEKGTHNIIEAPTGIGKSFAYLVPAIIFAKKHNRKGIISTCTINLQEQLMGKDIPALRNVLPYEFTSEILKGRQNYICTKRLNNALLKKSNLFEDHEQEELNKIYHYVQKHGKGTRQDIPFKISDNVWTQIFAEAGVCTAKSCGTENSNCYYQQAKVKLAKADIIVLNHYLFFTLFGFYEKHPSGYLYKDDFAVFDEAHTIDQIAAENVSPSVSRESIRFWLHKLYNPKTSKGFLADNRFDMLQRDTKNLLEDTDIFFEILKSTVYKLNSKFAGDKLIRLREPLNLNEHYVVKLQEYSTEILKLAQRAKNDDEENEIKNYHTKINIIKTNLIAFLKQKAENHVYWIDQSFTYRNNITLSMSPIDMAQYFRDNVFTDDKCSLMTSATLSINKSLDYFKKTVGADEVEGLIMESPFNFEEQMEIYIPKDMPEPKQNNYENISSFWTESDYEKSLKEKLPEYIEKTNGGTLVLFTNNKLLRKMHTHLLAIYKNSEIDILAQGEGLPKNKLLNEFLHNQNSVLLGVDSFWMGVDVPGDSLRSVIITKLPFDVPDHPIIEAKLEAIKERGGNPFMEFTLPGAVLKFKQGTGRLIRTRTDKGILVILDSRVVNKFYGKLFINSLPECQIHVV
jgi:ATP-dependent DNA helicase DinG